MKKRTVGNNTKEPKLWKQIRRVFVLISGFIATAASVLAIFTYFETQSVCYLISREEALNSGIVDQNVEGVFGKANYKDEEQLLSVIVGFREKVGFDAGGQIFQDIQRTSAIRNAARFLIREVQKLEAEQWSYRANVAFFGGSDGSGGNGTFSKRLDIGSLVLSVPLPIINGVQSVDTYEFQSGHKLDNIKLALVRAGFVSGIFLDEVESFENPPVFDRNFRADTNDSVGPAFRFGRLELEIELEKKTTILPLVPIDPEILCAWHP